MSHNKRKRSSVSSLLGLHRSQSSDSFDNGTELNVNMSDVKPELKEKPRKVSPTLPKLKEEPSREIMHQYRETRTFSEEDNRRQLNGDSCSEGQDSTRDHNSWGRIKTSIDDLRSMQFWKAAFAECLGTFILVLTSLGACMQDWVDDALDVVQIALTFGFSVATCVWIIGHISGGHINPAVTFAMLITRRISLIRGLLFVFAQIVGAILAAVLLKGVTPESLQGSLGATTLNKGVTVAMGFTVEFFITFVLVLTVFASCDSRRKDHGGSNPLAIGLAVVIGHLWAVEFTGSSMNPARSLGPAVVMDIWDNHWLYWIGPLTGGMVAAILYDSLLASNASLLKARKMLMASKFDDSQHPPVKERVHVIELADPKNDEVDA